MSRIPNGYNKPIKHICSSPHANWQLWNYSLIHILFAYHWYVFVNFVDNEVSLRYSSVSDHVSKKGIIHIITLIESLLLGDTLWI